MICKCSCGREARAADNEFERETVVYCPKGCHVLVVDCELFERDGVSMHEIEREVVQRWEKMLVTSATCVERRA